MKLQRLALTLLAAGTTALAATPSFAADSVKIAVIDPLSGPFANVGEAMVRYTQLAADAINARGGVLGGTRFEIIPLDSKS
ncbi:MAG TPA: ABC transporter substrate-binding protein, partial [Burkholderiales bacterium]|nr:ABC transporter substrate-binding protein [Burkholderiales bacterium]